MPNLLDLPEELVDNVCQSLQKADVDNLRITCQELKEKTYHQFAVKHFGTHTVMITRDSLQSLIDLSKNKTFGARSKTFGSCIRHLRISAASFPGQCLSVVDGLPLDEEKQVVYRFWKDEEAAAEIQKIRKRRRRAHARYMNEQYTLRKQSKDVMLLTAALSNLPAIDSISIIPAKHPTPDSHCPPDNMPWGMKQVRQETGLYPTSESRQSYWRTDQGETYERNNSWIVCAALSAIVASGRKLKQFSAETPFSLDFKIPKSPTSRTLTHIPARTLSESHFDSLKNLFSTLKVLSIKIEPIPLYSNRPQKSLEWVRRFTAISPCIEDFSFSAGNNTTDLYRDIAIGPAFPCLRILRLHDGNIAYDELAQLFATYSSKLEKIQLTGMTLRTHKWNEVLGMIQKMPVLTSLEISRAAYHRYLSMQWALDNPPDPKATTFSETLVIEEKTPLDMVQRLDKQISWQARCRRS